MYHDVCYQVRGIIPLLLLQKVYFDTLAHLRLADLEVCEVREVDLCVCERERERERERARERCYLEVCVRECV
jgi:hypothetical protein